MLINLHSHFKTANWHRELRHIGSICTASMNNPDMKLCNLSPPILVQNLGVNLTHIESRPSITKPGQEYDFYLDCQCDRDTLARLVKELEVFAVKVSVKTVNPEKDEGVRGCPVRVWQSL